MPFDFFNLSNLAFGNKLTMAFTQLERLVNEAKDHIDVLVRDLRIYAQYLNRNYQLTAPKKGSDGCRVDELYDIISEKVIVNNLEYSSGRLYLDCAIFNSNTGRITKLQGDTTLTSGWCYFNYAISNSDVLRQATFYSDQSSLHGVELFKFVVNTSAKAVTITWALR